MKRREWWPSIIIVGFLVFAGACNRERAERRNEAQSKAQDTGAMLKQQTQEVETRTNAELDAWDARINQLKDESTEVKSKARKDEWKNAIADLTRKRDTVKNRLTDLKSAGADTWQMASANLDAARNDLKTAYDEVVAKLGRTVTPPLRPVRSGS